MFSHKVRRLPRIAAAGLIAMALAACQSSPRPEVQAATPVLAPIAPILGAAEERGHSVLVVDAGSGAVLHEVNAEALRYPASLTKMMVLYMAFEDIAAGKLSLGDAMVVSPEAASRPPARLGLKAGSMITVRDAVTALAVKSANDVAVVMAEHLAGSEGLFASRMTQKARQLGMTRTRFVNASGLPDPNQVTTARDMAILGRALKMRFPQYASAFRTREFVYGGKRYEATNKLLGTVPGVDGIKTGYIRLAGYNIVASARRGGRQLIVVVMGGDSQRARDLEVASLMEQYF
ncbi:penicillin-binding protein [Agaricicola taiwanensis]|uniref:Penicillin-binding protein n=1 Tax=Agaricicola taiwanensis TaxID=591372 RepID=A0A8J2YGG3_9RHOB|nr:D-alanyl-D-alanine carboxypeptidase family protein [Agaricicola taiwanensis]GGE34973.1 penicillin-binding protein [Agaricicola taiwanensis]